MIVEDFVMLGKAVPELNKTEDRVMVCTIGYSEELRRPLRVYPMAVQGCPSRWSKMRIPLERNRKDSRDESWQIKGDRSPEAHYKINDVIEIYQEKIPVKEQQRIVDALIKYAADDPDRRPDVQFSLPTNSLKVANRKRLSLCIVIPTHPIDLYMEEEEGPVFPAFDRPVNRRFRFHPRLKFKDRDGKHDLMLRDWGAYERMRRTEEADAEDLAACLHLNRNGIPNPLLCGNFVGRRTAWLVVSVLSSSLNPTMGCFGQDDLFNHKGSEAA